MNNLTFIESGILELYITGIASAEEVREVEEMAAAHTDVREALDALYLTLETVAMENAVAPPVLIKPFLLATMDFMGRMGGGEIPSFPPELQTGATLADYAEWLDRPDMVKPSWFEDIHARIIGYTPQATTAIVWIKEMAPEEVHNNEYEKFLIVEGTCDIIVEGEDVHHLVPGDYLAIPLYKNHVVKVTSEIPCKVILQRIAVAA
jgi:mannose-6-phosphate isomerase-like protein (cupin superfamily)